MAPPAQSERTGRHAFLVASGILLSRLVGLVRQSVFSGYFGISYTADAFNAAWRIPNFLQNLFGEGVLSASFIPVYARLLAEGDEEEADRVAGAIFAILALTVSVLVLLGVLCAPLLIVAIAPGFHGAKRDLTIHLVRILFPSIGLLVLSAWCLGNSQQPSQVLPVLHRSRSRQPGADRHHGRVSPPACDHARRHAGMGLGRGQRVAVRRAGAHRAPADAETAAAPGHGIRARPRGHPQFRTRLRQPRRGADQRLHRLASRQPFGRRSGGRAVHRADAERPTREPVRNGGFGGATAGHVQRPGRRGAGGRLPPPAPGFRPAPDRVLRGPLGHGLSGARRRGDRRALPARKRSRATTRSTSGASWPEAPSGCWLPRWAASTRPPTTPSATRARRCASPSSASR